MRSTNHKTIYTKAKYSQTPDPPPYSGRLVYSSVTTTNISFTSRPAQQDCPTYGALVQSIVALVQETTRTKALPSDCSSAVESVSVGSQDLESTSKEAWVRKQKIIQKMARSGEASKLDPAVRAEAAEIWSQSIEWCSIVSLRQTHDTIDTRFKHGPHAGASVEDLTRRLPTLLHSRRGPG